MRFAFGYTIVDPLRERRVKYYDENGIYDESVQSDDELIVIGEKLRNGGYRYNEELGKAETAWDAKEKLDEDIYNAIDRANNMIKAAFNGNPKYMNFNERYIRAEYCVSVEIYTGDNSWYVKDESERRPDDGWPWKPDKE